MSDHRLSRLFRQLADSVYPPENGQVDVVGPPPGIAQAVVAFTRHHVVAVDLDPDRVLSKLDPDDLGAPMRPRFLTWLADQLDAESHMLNLVMFAIGTGEGSPLIRRDDLFEHPRVVRAARFRTDLELYSNEYGNSVLVLGKGLAGRRELALEIPASQRNAATGRKLVRAAMALTPRGVPLFAQVAPGNAASVRAFYNAGFRPVGAEVLLTGSAD